VLLISLSNAAEFLRSRSLHDEALKDTMEGVTLLGFPVNVENLASESRSFVVRHNRRGDENQSPAFGCSFDLS